MRIGNEAAHIEMVVAEVEHRTAESRGGDVRLGVRVHHGDFSGATDAWVLRGTWERFLAAMRLLEQRRQGEAVLESISPREMRLRVFAIDRAGHVAVEGEVGTLRHGSEAYLQFSAIEFDPSDLPSLLSELVTASAKLASGS